MAFAQRLLGLGIALFLVGCGGQASGPPLPEGPSGSVKGKVTYEGKPLTKGILSLDSGKGFLAGAPIQPDGTFTLEGPNGTQIPAGTYQVGVSPPPPPKPEGTPAAGAQMSQLPTIEGLPEKFYSPASSGVTVEVKPGEQDLVIELK